MVSLTTIGAIALIVLGIALVAGALYITIKSFVELGTISYDTIILVVILIVVAIIAFVAGAFVGNYKGGSVTVTK